MLRTRGGREYVRFEDEVRVSLTCHYPQLAGLKLLILNIAPPSGLVFVTPDRRVRTRMVDASKNASHLF